MPYIPQEQRDKIPTDPGRLNHRITRVLLWYLKYKGEKYQTYNDIFGVLECIKHEFYRRLVAKYEDKKRDENGEVYP